MFVICLTDSVSPHALWKLEATENDRLALIGVTLVWPVVTNLNRHGSFSSRPFLSPLHSPRCFNINWWCHILVRWDLWGPTLAPRSYWPILCVLTHFCPLPMLPQCFNISTLINDATFWWDETSGGRPWLRGLIDPFCVYCNIIDLLPPSFAPSPHYC